MYIVDGDFGENVQRKIVAEKCTRCGVNNIVRLIEERYDENQGCFTGGHVVKWLAGGMQNGDAVCDACLLYESW